MKSRTAFFLIGMATPALVTASVTINLQVLATLDSNGNSVPIGSVGVLVANSSATNPFAGDYMDAIANADFSAFIGNLTAGSKLGGNDDLSIIALLPAKDLGGGIVGFDDLITDIDVTGEAGYTTGNRIGFYWFPTITGNSISGSLPEYGFYRTNTVDSASGSDIAWNLPADGAIDTLAVAPDPIVPGSLATVADLTAIPEPTTYAVLFGALALGAAYLRRRRA